MNKRKLVTNREDTTMKFNISGMFDNTLSIVIAALLAALFPLAEIWSINTLFNTNIEYNFTTWMAAVILSGALSSRFILKGV